MHLGFVFVKYCVYLKVHEVTNGNIVHIVLF